MITNLENLIDNNGVTYSEFRKTLRINYSTILIDIFLSISMIFFSIFLFYVSKNYFYISLILLLPVTLFISFWKQSYKMHFHEAAHFNLSNNKKFNDFLANTLFTPFTGMWVDNYRRSHWKHHNYLGELNDTEISYHKPISTFEILKKLTAVYLVQTVLRYYSNFKNNNSSNIENDKIKFGLLSSIFLMLLVQTAIILLLFYYVSLICAVAWTVSIIIFDPFISGIRQTLEHRNENAMKNNDYSKISHGATNRIFGNDFISKHFGAAGFNKHLLHHYDPSISYTEFEKLEKYLLNTKLRDDIKKNTTSYFKIFNKILSQ